MKGQSASAGRFNALIAATRGVLRSPECSNAPGLAMMAGRATRRARVQDARSEIVSACPAEGAFLAQERRFILMKKWMQRPRKSAAFHVRL